MMIRVVLLLFACLFIKPVPIDAQIVAHQPGEYLVSLIEGTEPDALFRQLDSDIEVKKVANLLNIWLLRSDLPEQETLARLRRLPAVRSAQFNHILENRSTPNDPLFPQQWHFLNDGSSGGVFDADLDAEQAWDISTGGLTPAGDTIVIAVIDGGLEAAHPDIAPNLWYNWAEIPNNGLDDDGNGYIDDFRGWNVFAASDAIEGQTTAHGTPVSGIIGAKGDNGIGVSGVNWTTKIMFVSAGGTEAEILAAYDYVLQARTRYNTSIGQSGAFVVSVNCSWGINFGQPAESPLWCEAFDLLGAAGIVSVAATANQAVDVDVVGDLPTACPSNFLISVTSLNRQDQKAPNAAWGKYNVDLGAYGHEVYTTANNSGYGYFNGTSFSAPQVAGAIGLLYSAPCPNLIALAKTDPVTAAYWVKSLILDNVTPNPSLEEKVLTDGRLNLYRALQNYQNQCSSCPAPFALKTETLTDSSVMLLWTVPPSALSVNMRWRILSMGAWDTVSAVVNSYLLDDLSPCTSYEFEMQSVCDGLESAWSQPFIFETKGCCTVPSTFGVDSISAEMAQISWELTSFNNTYVVRVREAWSGTWNIIEVTGNSWAFENLDPCTVYQVQIQSRCEDYLTDFTPVFSFETKGCGACNEVDYCTVMGQLATEEWIESIQLGTWFHYTGPGGNGYQNFTSSPPASLEFVGSQPIYVKITPGHSGAETKEYYRIFIDFNQDGDFEDDYELAFDPGFALEGPAEGWIQMPDNLTPGITRMRVMMKYTNPNDPPPAACSSFDFGQVEDYCAVFLLDSIVVSVPANDATWVLRAYPQPARDAVILELPEATSGIDCTLRVMDQMGRTIFEENAPVSAQGKVYLDTQLWPAGVYAVQLTCAGKVFCGKLMKN